MTSAKKLRTGYGGSASRPSLDATFSYGFRPFFLAAAGYAAFIISAWIAWIASIATGTAADWLAVSGSPIAWHAHEMVYGFAAAAIAGFLLTAVPNWTGALPLSGLPLVSLVGVWFLGRIAACISGLLPYPVYMGLDLLFLPLLAGFAARQLILRPAARNLVFLAILAALTGCNVFFHLANGGYAEGSPIAAARLALSIIVVMIAIIGGRIIPAFTHNWIHINRPAEARPRSLPWLDKLAIAFLVLFVLVEPTHMAPLAKGCIAALAAVANGMRLAFWRGFATRSEPILWILHVGYACIIIGLGLAAAAAFTGLVPSAAVTHAFGTGAAGTMILAVMSRASLGHTGRRLQAPPLVVWVYYLISVAALLRVSAPFLPDQVHYVALAAAALAWIGAFVLFLVVYVPILITPRVHTKIAQV